MENCLKVIDALSTIIVTVLYAIFFIVQFP